MIPRLDKATHPVRMHMDDKSRYFKTDLTVSSLINTLHYISGLITLSFDVVIDNFLCIRHGLWTLRDPFTSACWTIDFRGEDITDKLIATYMPVHILSASVKLYISLTKLL